MKENKTLYFLTGFFIILGIAALLGLTLFFTGKNFFKKTYTVYAIFDNVGGLVKGAQVRISGVVVGKVKEIKLQPNGKVKVALEIEKKYKIPANATAIIKTTGFLGDKYVEIIFKPSKNFLKDGDVIYRTLPPTGIGELIREVQPGIKKLNEFLTTKNFLERLKTLVDNFTQVAQNINSILTEIKKGEGTVGKLIKSEEVYVNLNKTLTNFQVLSKNLNQLINSIKQGQGTLGKLLKNDTLYYKLVSSVNNIEDFSRKLNSNDTLISQIIYNKTLAREIQEIVENFKKTSENIVQITEQIKRGNGTLGKLLYNDSLYYEIQTTLKQIQEAAQNFEEQVPISVLGTVAGSALR